jgi:Protein of unknown function (DUF3298).
LEGYHVLVKENQLQQEMKYKNHIILKYTIKYPRFISGTYYTLMSKLNALYRTKALIYQKNNVMNLYQMAMAEYEYSVAHNYPVREFEAYVNYEVTYNQNCALSLYFDQYEYSGGAHGLTERESDNWDLQRSRRMEMADYYPNQSNYKDIVMQEIIDQIKTQIASGDAMYFDDYEKLVRDTFKPKNFYLSPEGLVIYFQQYDIAPYAAGIPTFTIPYTPNGPVEPQCG